MKLCIRGHDLGVKGTEAIIARLRELDIDGLQLVCYKSFDDIPYAPGGITREKADRIGAAMRDAGVIIPLVGAYFNQAHPDSVKAQKGFDVFAEYLKVLKALGGEYVGSETGSYNGDPWIYHPKNRTPKAYEQVADTFGRLADIAADNGVNIAMEGAAGHVCWNPKVLNRVVRMMDRPNVKIIFDLFNYMDGGNQFDYLDILDRGLELFGKNILLFHMKDCLLHEDGSAPRQVGFGQGDLDKEAILGRIKASDPDAVLVLEGTTGDDIPIAVKTIREIWARV